MTRPPRIHGIEAIPIRPKAPCVMVHRLAALQRFRSYENPRSAEEPFGRSEDRADHPEKPDLAALSEN